MQNGGTVEIARGSNGHFVVDGDVGGTRLSFVVDTGASTVALTIEDARRVGVEPPASGWTAQVRTAGGTVRAAPVTLPRLAIGRIQLVDVPATIIDQPGMPALLGQSALSKLDAVAIADNRMTLTRR